MQKNSQPSVWGQSSENTYQQMPAFHNVPLPIGVYHICSDGMENRYLKRISNKFELPAKLYGNPFENANHILTTWRNTNANLGAMFCGTKGTGKTILAELICNMSQLPVIVVNSCENYILPYLANFPGECVVLFDEFEKVFSEERYNNIPKLLTLLDGATTGSSRKLFLFTINYQNSLDDNLIQRLGRIRYNIIFTNLAPEVVKEIINDLLVDKTIAAEVFEFISTLDLITMDVVIKIIEECNIHNCAPIKFAHLLNIKFATCKYNVNELTITDGKIIPTPLFSNVTIVPSPDSWTNYGTVGDALLVRTEGINIRFGRIQKVLSSKELIVQTLEPDWYSLFPSEADKEAREKAEKEWLPKEIIVQINPIKDFNSYFNLQLAL